MIGMTSVRITVQSTDGDVSVEYEYQTTRLGDDERQRISELLQQAVRRIDRAYGLRLGWPEEQRPRMRLGGEAGA